LIVLTQVHQSNPAYQKEYTKQSERIKRLEDSGADIHDIRKQQEVLLETTEIIPDCKIRLIAAKKALADVVCTMQGEEGIEDYVQAEQLLEELNEVC
jgi:tubulin-specific chaperone A